MASTSRPAGLTCHSQGSEVRRVLSIIDGGSATGGAPQAPQGNPHPMCATTGNVSPLGQRVAVGQCFNWQRKALFDEGAVVGQDHGHFCSPEKKFPGTLRGGCDQRWVLLCPWAWALASAWAWEGLWYLEVLGDRLDLHPVACKIQLAIQNMWPLPDNASFLAGGPNREADRR